MWGGPNRGVYPRGGTVRCVARGAGADSKDLVGPRPIQGEFGLEHLCIGTGFRALANIDRIIHTNPIAHNGAGNLAQRVRKG